MKQPPTTRYKFYILEVEQLMIENAVTQRTTMNHTVSTLVLLESKPVTSKDA